jgi:predicted phosphodiesterase
MQYAIISDIHGNLEALQAALKHIDTLDVGGIVCLGDIVGYGPNPNECVDLVRMHCVHTVKGNHDAAAVDLMETMYMNRLAREAVIWTHDRLNPGAKEFLRQLPLKIPIENATLVHASPHEPEEWHYIITSLDAELAFKHFDTAVCFIGHSHRPGIFTTNNGRTTERRIINVGSIGQPRDRDPKLSFGLFDTATLVYENIRLSYEVEKTADKMFSVGLPSELAERLFYGL